MAVFWRQQWMIMNMTLTMMTTMLFQGRPRKMWQLRKHRAPPLRCQGGYIFIFTGIKNHHYYPKKPRLLVRATSTASHSWSTLGSTFGTWTSISTLLRCWALERKWKNDNRNNMIIEGMVKILTRSSSSWLSSSSSPGSRCDQQPRRHLEVPGRSRRSARGGQFKTSKIFASEGKISRKMNTFFVYRRRLKKKQRNE